MKALFLSSEDYLKRGGSSIDVYHNMIAAVGKAGIEAEHRFVGLTERLLQELEEFKPDMVFNGAYYTLDQDGTPKFNVHAVLRQLNIPFVGSEVDALELVIDKAELKRVWQKAGIQTPGFYRLNKGMTPPSSAFPILLKPTAEGSSRGIDESSVVYSREELDERVTDLAQRGFTDIMAEQYLEDGTEFTIGVIGRGNRKIIGPSQMTYTGEGNKTKVITSDMKEGKPGTRIWEPVPVPPGDLRDAVIERASRMYDAAGVQDYGRCDIIMDKQGRLNSIEINGQSVIESYFLTGLRSEDIDHTAAINLMFLASIMRNREEGNYLPVPEDMSKVIPPGAYRAITG